MKVRINDVSQSAFENGEGCWPSRYAPYMCGGCARKLVKETFVEDLPYNTELPNCIKHFARGSQPNYRVDCELQGKWYNGTVTFMWGAASLADITLDEEVIHPHYPYPTKRIRSDKFSCITPHETVYKNGVAAVEETPLEKGTRIHKEVSKGVIQQTDPYAKHRLELAAKGIEKCASSGIGTKNISLVIDNSLDVEPTDLLCPDTDEVPYGWRK